MDCGFGPRGLTERPHKTQCGIRNARLYKMWPRPPRDLLSRTTLAARSTPRRLQAGHVHVQDAARPDTTVLVGRLSAQTPTQVADYGRPTRSHLPCHARTRTRLGDRSFAVAGPQIWNSLPADLRLVDNYARFRQLLKGHMFG